MRKFIGVWFLVLFILFFKEEGFLFGWERSRVLLIVVVIEGGVVEGLRVESLGLV